MTEQNAASARSDEVQNAGQAPEPHDELAAIQAERDTFKDLAYRAAAELENYKRRAAKEREELSAAQKERVVSRILPTLDAFDMATSAVGADVPEEVRKKYLEGYQAIGRQLWSVMESLGVSAIQIAADADFHPGEQEAILTEEVDGLKSPMVLQVMQKGYCLDGRLIRPARVKVGMPKSEVQEHE